MKTLGRVETIAWKDFVLEFSAKDSMELFALPYLLFSLKAVYGIEHKELNTELLLSEKAGKKCLKDSRSARKL